MGATGYSIASVVTVPLGETVSNLIKDLPGVKLAKPSAVRIYLTREDVGLLFTVTIGGTNVYPGAPANINPVNGTLPSTQDDEVIEVLAQRGDEILISGTNSSAGDLEGRVLVKVMPVGS